MFQISFAGRAHRARIHHRGFLTWLGVGVLALAALIVPRHAMAACTTSFTVTSGGSYTLDAASCDSSGFGIGTNTNTVSTWLISGPSHGSVANTPYTSGSINTTGILYTNNGDGATSDSFVWQDAGGANHTETITVTAAPLSITTSSLPNGTVGSSYSATLTSSGGSGTTRAWSSTALPSGLSLNSSTGVISGTPTAAGTTSVTFTVSDGTTTANKTLSITVYSAVGITTSSLPNGTVGASYSASLTASGGTGTYTWSSTALPAGLSLNSSTGAITGTPSAARTTSVTFTVTDGTSTAQKTLSITIYSAVSITTSSLPNGTVGSSYSATLAASGGSGSYAWSSTALPAGLSLNSSTGDITGTPSAAGTTSVTFTVSDGSTTASKTLSITVDPPPLSITTSSLSNATVGGGYGATLTASGGATPYSWSVSSGSLPPGLSLNSLTGVISGTPTAGGTYNLTFQVTDSSSTTQTATKAISLTVNAPTITLSPASGTTLNAAVQGSSYSQQFTASGGTAPYNYQVTGGALPNGLSLAVGGQLSGTPTQAGTFNFTVTAYDSSTGTGSPYSVAGSYTLDVQPIAPIANPVSDTVSYGSVSNVVPTSFTGGTPTSVAIASAASHGSATASGTSITYTPTAGYTGTDSFTYTGTNSAGTSAPATVSITVSGPTLAITSSSGGTSLTATVGQSFTQTFTFSGGQAPYQGYSITGIPAGLNVTAFDTTSITISGTPTVSGTFTLNVSGTDSSTGTDPSSGKNAPFTVSQSFTLQISPASMSVSPASGALPGATVGVAYGQSITASGGISPYTYAVTSGVLPSGVTLTAGGLLKGTPTSVGTFSFQVTATDSSTGASSPATASASYTLNVAAPTVVLNPSTLPGATQNSAYSQTLTASGGTASYSYAVTSGSLPTGITLSSGGVLSGTPTVYGSYTFTVTATDSSTGSGAPYTGSRSYTLSVGASTPVITTTSLANGTVGVSYSQTITASSGNPAYAYSVSAGSLPTGLSLSSGGVLSGTPTAGGSFTFTVQVTDSASSTATQSYTVAISAPTITLSPSSLPGATQNSAYSQTLTASGGTASYSYAVTSGALPTGITLSSGGVLSGTPTVYGTYTFTVTATDSSTGSGPYTGSRSYTLSVGASTPVITTASLANGTVGVSYSQTITASSGNPAYAYSISAGSLPTGLSLSSGGVLSGTPTAGGSFTFTVQVTDSASSTATRSYTVAISAPTITVSPTTLPVLTQFSSYNQTITASGGTAPYTYAVTSGSLPSGLSLSPGGALSGTPTVSGSFNITVTATDSSTGSGPYTGSQAYTLTVALGTPIANPDSASTLAEQAVTIPVTSNDTGTINSIAIATAPGHGTATVSGTSVVYTPTGTFYGTDTFTYTATNSAGTSAPAKVTVTVKPLPPPTIKNQSVQVLSGQSVSIDATAGATGGPFTKATLSTAPTVGTATVSGTTITYKAPAGASGSDQFTYTLSNAYGTSAPATVTLSIVPRPDPTKDTQVMGLLNAQAESTRRFMRGQIDNFQSRLESLHDGGNNGGFQNNLTMVFSGGRQAMRHGPQPLPTIDMSADGLHMNSRSLSTRELSGGNPSDPSATGQGHNLTVWASGALNFGTQKLGGSHNGIDFNTSGLTLGADTHLSDRLAMGGGIGFGHDASDIGKNGSRSTADAYNVAGYASYKPTDDTFVDGVIGYQWLSFNSHRYVTTDGNFVNGSRNGSQVFGSLSAGLDRQHGNMRLSPYGRLDMARATLDAYTESGDPVYALHYMKQNVDTTSGTLGLRMDWSFKRSFGSIQPMLRLEYRHDFQGSSDVTIRYADMIGPTYRGTLGDQSQDHTMLGLGLQTQSFSGLKFRIEYQNTFESSTTSNQAILLHLEKPFD